MHSKAWTPVIIMWTLSVGGCGSELSEMSDLDRPTVLTCTMKEPYERESTFSGRVDRVRNFEGTFIHASASGLETGNNHPDGWHGETNEVHRISVCASGEGGTARNQVIFHRPVQELGEGTYDLEDGVFEIHVSASSAFTCAYSTDWDLYDGLADRATVTIAEPAEGVWQVDWTARFSRQLNDTPLEPQSTTGSYIFDRQAVYRVSDPTASGEVGDISLFNNEAWILPTWIQPHHSALSGRCRIRKEDGVRNIRPSFIVRATDADRNDGSGAQITIDLHTPLAELEETSSQDVSIHVGLSRPNRTDRFDPITTFNEAASIAEVGDNLFRVTWSVDVRQSADGVTREQTLRGSVFLERLASELWRTRHEIAPRRKIGVESRERVDIAEHRATL